MRRRKVSENESLELLLDTICNTFGGIIFISLLIVILLNTTSTKVRSANPPAVAKSELIEQEIHRVELTAKLVELSEKVRQQEQIAGVVNSTELQQVATAYSKEGKSQVDLSTEISDTTGESVQFQTRINQLYATQTDRANQLNAAKREASSLKIKVNDVIESRSRVATIPKVSESNAIPAVYFLIGGRLYGPYQGGSNEFSTVPSLTGTQLVHNPGTGLNVSSPNVNIQALRTKLQRGDSLHDGVRIYAWSDSFENWDVLREVLAQDGIRHHLVPCRDGEKLYLGSGPASSSSFQ